MAFSGYEKPLNEYTKSELIDIAQKYTIYYQTSSGRSSISNYKDLTKEELIGLIENDKDYQRAQPKSRIGILKNKIKGL